jgi:lysylphosphatidylglycerol synthetase-like protein (DUF2156 family)
VIGSSLDSEIWLCPDGRGAVPYAVSGSIWMVAGEPLAAGSDLGDVTRGFLAEARRRRKTVAFLPATERFARAVSNEDFRIIKVGASPYFDLTKWNPRGNAAKHLRAGVNRGRRSGLSVAEVTELTPEFRSEVNSLMHDWGQNRRAGVRFGWLFESIPFDKADEKRYFAARDAVGTLVGVIAASAIPARDGWYLEDIFRRSDAPDGTSDLLVFETLRILARSGAKLATLGTVPLSSRGGNAISRGRNGLVERGIDISRSKLGGLYNFDGLGQFKAKFVPCWWENEYIVVSRGRLMTPPRVANALFELAVPGGLLSVLSIVILGDPN